MTRLDEAAMLYEPKRTMNISDLEEVPVSIEVEEQTRNEGTPDEFSILVAKLGDEEYRVPKSVLSQVQDFLKDERTKDMKLFKVLKKGTGINDTRYTVVPLGVK